MENTVNFEEALTRLDEIVKALESGSSDLDASLALFEEGIKLVRLCSARLDDAEQRVKVLISNGNGEYDERDLPKTE